MLPFLLPLLLSGSPAQVSPAAAAPMVQQATAPASSQGQSAPSSSSASGPSPGKGLLDGYGIFPVSRGTPPDVWGRSQACANLVRKNAKIARRSKHYKGKRR